MAQQARTINSLLLPLSDFHLVLPQATVAEVAPRPEVMPAISPSDWLLGMFYWRSDEVPLISFEKLCGEAPPVRAHKSYVATLHGLEVPRLDYYAIELKALPHPARLTPESMTRAADDKGGSEVLGMEVRIAGQRAVIPALPEMERLIRSALGKH